VIFHMYSIVIKIGPGKLVDPNLDMRYVLPDLIVERSGNLIQADGYDYATQSDAMLVYLTTKDLKKALPIVIDVVENATVLGNCLKDAVIVAAGFEDDYAVIYPPNYEQPFNIA
jgi:hypothetical protein